MPICQQCQKPFEPTFSRQVYCSQSCGGKARYRAGRKGEGEQTCCHCGSTYQPKRKGTAYCSRECAFARRAAIAEQKAAERAAMPKPKRQAVCVACEAVFEPAGGERYCGDECRKMKARLDAKADYHNNRKRWHTLACRICKQEFESSISKATVCPSVECRRLVYLLQKTRDNHRRAARLAQVPSEKYDPLTIFERDDWTCQECGQQTTREHGFPHPLYPTLDHIMPISKGGPDTEANLRCCCFLCNSTKRDSLKEPAEVA